MRRSMLLNAKLFLLVDQLRPDQRDVRIFNRVLILDLNFVENAEDKLGQRHHLYVRARLGDFGDDAIVI